MMKLKYILPQLNRTYDNKNDKRGIVIVANLAIIDLSKITDIIGKKFVCS